MNLIEFDPVYFGSIILPIFSLILGISIVRATESAAFIFSNIGISQIHIPYYTWNITLFLVYLQLFEFGWSLRCHHNWETVELALFLIAPVIALFTSEVLLISRIDKSDINISKHFENIKEKFYVSMSILVIVIFILNANFRKDFGFSIFDAFLAFFLLSMIGMKCGVRLINYSYESVISAVFLLIYIYFLSEYSVNFADPFKQGMHPNKCS